ncbi:MAG: small basic protein [Planctomycetota bacterium]|nr:small basic protein [Planctomycetota bacterium]MDG2084310.1 small basic protein [Planctomycetota bacterium]
MTANKARVGLAETGRIFPLSGEDHGSSLGLRQGGALSSLADGKPPRYPEDLEPRPQLSGTHRQRGDETGFLDGNSPPEAFKKEDYKMSIHRTLKTGSGIGGTRNVLTRYERILQMESQGRFNEEEDNPVGLPKTRVLKIKKRAKKKKEKEDTEES